MLLDGDIEKASKSFVENRIDEIKRIEKERFSDFLEMTPEEQEMVIREYIRGGSRLTYLIYSYLDSCNKISKFIDVVTDLETVFADILSSDEVKSLIEK